MKIFLDDERWPVLSHELGYEPDISGWIQEYINGEPVLRFYPCLRARQHRAVLRVAAQPAGAASARWPGSMDLWRLPRRQPRADRRPEGWHRCAHP